MNIALVFLTFFIWSTTFTLGKVTLAYAPPLYLTGIRMLFAGVLILLFLVCFRRQSLKLTRAHILPILLLSITAVYLTNAFEFWGLQYLTAAKACFIYSLSPFLSALFSYLQFKEKMTVKKVIGLVMGFLGFIPVMLQQSGGEQAFGGAAFFSWPEIALMIAVVTSVYGWVLLRKLGKEGVSPLMANGTSMCIGGAFALIHSWTLEGGFFPVSNPIGFFEGVFLMIVISNLLCYNLYGFLLKRFTATFLSFAGLLTPLFAAFFGYIVLGESVSLIFFLSMGIIAFGLWLVYAEELRLGYIAKVKSPQPIKG